MGIETYKRFMGNLLELDQNITYQENLLKEREMAAGLERDTRIKEIEDLDIQIEDLKRQFSQTLLTKKQSLDLETNELRSLSSLQNHLIQEQRKNMDYLIINKLLKKGKAKDSEGLESSQAEGSKKGKEGKKHIKGKSATAKHNHDQFNEPKGENKTLETSKPKAVSPFPLTKLPTAPIKDIIQTAPVTTTVGGKNTSATQTTKITAPTDIETTNPKETPKANPKNSTTPSSSKNPSQTLPTATPKKPKYNIGGPSPFPSPGKRNNRFKQDRDFSDIEEPSDPEEELSKTDPKDLMFFDSE